MILGFYQNLPLHIDPIAFSIGSFSLRWYSLSYVAGFVVVYFIFMYRIKLGESNNIYQISNKISNSKSQVNEKANEAEKLMKLKASLVDFLLIEFLAIIIGGRIGYVFFYDFSYFISHPLAILSPYDGSGNFVGIFGMSYHGAMVGGILAGYFFTKIRKINFWQWADFVIVALPAGYFFGRIGNFLNGELYGRVTESQLGMHFLADPDMLRYPSQLIEALLEGAVVFVILWAIRKKIKNPGVLFPAYLISYAIARIISEQFREPDAQIGFLALGITMGQLLSVIMLACGLILLLKKKGKWYNQ